MNEIPSEVQHGNMLRTITEEPPVREGKNEVAARGPKPLLIKKQRSIEDENNITNEEESMVHSNRTGPDDDGT